MLTELCICASIAVAHAVAVLYQVLFTHSVTSKTLPLTIYGILEAGVLTLLFWFPTSSPSIILFAGSAHLHVHVAVKLILNPSPGVFCRSHSLKEVLSNLIIFFLPGSRQFLW